jgi:N-acetylmuramoyl-L-alanine amidase
MFGGRIRLSRWAQNVIAWIGLLLMLTSFAWLQWTSPPAAAKRERALPSAREPFPVVVLDPGHGGQDSGAMVGEILEKDLTLDVAQRVDRLLQSQGLATVMTRVGDSYVSLADRASLTNRVPDCVLVSIHFNEGNKPVSSGVETYYADHQTQAGRPVISWLPFLQRIAAEAPNLESQSLAGFIQEALVARTKAANRGTKPEHFFVITNVRHPAVLVEGGFLTNKEDIARLSSIEYREQIATAISEGIIRYRDLLKQRPPTLAVTGSAGAE